MENNNTVTLEQPKKMDISLLVLWIVGWIFCYPIPALIIIWRKKNPWNQATKMLATIALTVLVLFTAILTVIVRGMISYAHNQNIEAVEDTVDDSVIEEDVTIRPNLLDEAQKFDRRNGKWQTDVIDKCSITDARQVENCNRIANAICQAQNSNVFQVNGATTVMQFDEDNLLITSSATTFPNFDKVPVTILISFDPDERADGDFDYELHYCSIDGYDEYDDGTFGAEWNQFEVMENLKKN